MGRILFGFICFSCHLIFGQDNSIKDLKNASDKASSVFTDKSQSDKKKSKTLFVNPFIGTGGHGHTYPGASAPFGMIQLSPDTRLDNWDGCSGYHYSDSVIYGFSHTHLSGVGVPDYCDLLIVPQSGEAKIIPGYKDSKNGYGQTFSHKQEHARPGYYDVHLNEQNIDARLTVSERAGLHEYTFQTSNEKRYILIDLDHRDKVLDAGISVSKDEKSISGYRISSSWATDQHVYFFLQTDVPFMKSKLIMKNGQHKLLLTFSSDVKKLMIRVGISSVDEQGAKNNAESEMPDFDFNRALAGVTSKWEKELNRIWFSSSIPETNEIFYTSLYHNYLQPNLFSDVDGRYRGMDKQIHSITDNSPQYTVFSLWDTYRGAHPLYTITQQKRTVDFIQTFLRQYDQSGNLPVWELAANETGCMIGYHSASVISDAYAKGIGGYDAKKALLAMIESANKNELGKTEFHKFGFISSGNEPESVSKTLEYGYDDFCIGALGEKLNDRKFSSAYLSSSLNFIHVFDPVSKFMRARRGAMWYSPFEPTEVNFNFTEANSYQYSLAAPHAIDIMAELLGGKDSLETWLDRLFTTGSKLSGRDQADITGLIGQYAHGNEPSHHMAYLYNYTNAKHKTQFYTNKILRELYSNTPEGLSGNEDCGQMSAWYVLSALGFYQVCPGKPFYDFGRPLMDEATINFENGRKMYIKVVNNSEKNLYIQSIQLNGQPYYQIGITHDELMKGGEMIITMGESPAAATWKHPGSALKMKDLEKYGFRPSPNLLNEQRLFEDSIVLHLGQLVKTPKCQAITSYRFKNKPSEHFVFKDSLVLYKSDSLEFMTHCEYIDNYEILLLNGAWIPANFIKRDPTVHLNLKSTYSPQYASEGANSLIDGITGGVEFRTGEFQGFWDQDLITEVSFDSARVLSEIGISCLQDMKSWIFFPSEIQIEVSYDGSHFESLPNIVTNVNFASNGPTAEIIPSFSTYVSPMRKEFYRKITNTKKIKAIRMKAKNYGKCPHWHLGAGNQTWLFADELIFR